ncbi:MAG: O-acetylhomoserine aminocarboxypropyltransferase/cysteine synthase family protein [Candidatus Cybelea sp.]
MTNGEREFGFSTRALHAGTPPDPATGARAAPIYQTSAFVFGSTEQAAELFALRSYGHIYSRISNPTVAAFEERMASLEGGLGGLAFSSGLAAQLCTVLSLAQNGDHLVCTQNVYGGTVTQLSVTIKRMGIETTFVPAENLDAVRAAIRPNTKLVFVETIGNPSGVVPDMAAFAELAHAAGIPLVVDNTFATPYFCRPIEHGADIVVHSATKFINGHGTAIGGVLVESGKFPWENGRFPLLSTPSPGYHQKVFTETFGEYAFLMRARAEVLRDVGAQMSPMDAWLALLGLETLPVRMDRHVSNARAVVEFLKSHPDVAWVREPQLGSIFTFGLRGGRPAARHFIDALVLWSHLANVGDSKSLVIHPASTTHSQLSDDELRNAGVEPEAVRLSVGLEDVADLIWDLEQALRAEVPVA